MTKAQAVPHETRQPFELSEELAARVDELGLGAYLTQSRDEGYTIVPEISTPRSTERLLATCIALALKTESAAKGLSAALLLGRDPIFEAVLVNSKILALVEVMYGKGALLSQLITSIQPKSGATVGLHADQNWTPAPFPVQSQLFTMCWTMEGFTKAGGATLVVPKSHRLRQHPDPADACDQKGAIVVE